MEADQNHVPATEAAARLCERSRLILLPTAVFVETLNGLGKRSGHETALETARDFIVQDHFGKSINCKGWPNSLSFIIEVGFSS
jgi:hypothetical protein